MHQQRTQLGNNDLSFNDDIFNLALNDLQDRVLSMGGRELSEYGLPHPQIVDNDRFARVYRREIDIITKLNNKRLWRKITSAYSRSAASL